MRSHRLAHRLRRIGAFRAAFFVLLLVLVGAGVAVGSVVSSRTDGSSTSTDTMGPEAFESDGTAAIIAVTARDPDGGLPWAVRVYRSRSGYPCAEVGRSQDGDFGRVDDNGQFRAVPLDQGGNPNDPTRAPNSFVVNHYRATTAHGARAVIFGLATASVRSVTLTAPGTATDVPVRNGAFIAVVADQELAGATATITHGDGTSNTYNLHPQKWGDADGPVEQP